MWKERDGIILKTSLILFCYTDIVTDKTRKTPWSPPPIQFRQVAVHLLSNAITADMQFYHLELRL